jgi:hypothetical protein
MGLHGLLQGELFFCLYVTSSVTLREKHTIKAFEKRMKRRIFGAKREEITACGENFTVRSVMIWTGHQILLR